MRFPRGPRHCDRGRARRHPTGGEGSARPVAPPGRGRARTIREPGDLPEEHRFCVAFSGAREVAAARPPRAGPPLLSDGRARPTERRFPCPAPVSPPRSRCPRPLSFRSLLAQAPHAPGAADAAPARPTSSSPPRPGPSRPRRSASPRPSSMPRRSRGRSRRPSSTSCARSRASTSCSPDGAGSVTSLFLRGTDLDADARPRGRRAAEQPVLRTDVDLSAVSTANVERIEVVRGPFSALWGSEAIGGVVQLFTRRAAPERRSKGARRAPSGTPRPRRGPRTSPSHEGPFAVTGGWRRVTEEGALPNESFAATNLSGARRRRRSAGARASASSSGGTAPSPASRSRRACRRRSGRRRPT